MCGNKKKAAPTVCNRNETERKRLMSEHDHFADVEDDLIKRCDDVAAFEVALKNAPKDKLVIIDFYAKWCGPCRMMATHYHRLAEQLGIKAIFLKVDVDINEELASSYDIFCMPTFVLFKNSKKIEECSGTNVDKLKEIIKSKI